MLSSVNVNEFQSKIKKAGFINVRYNNDVLVSMATELIRLKVYGGEEIQAIYYHPKKKYWLVKRTLKNILEIDSPEIKDMFRPYEDDDEFDEEFPKLSKKAALKLCRGED